MDGTLTFWGLAIPTVLATALGSLVSLYLSHRGAKEIKAIESRLNREEEAFRVAQSPRVQAALELWSAFCAFEKATEAVVSALRLPDLHGPASVPALTNPANRRFWADARAKQERAGVTWQALIAARARAECLMDEATFQKACQLFSLYESAFSSVVISWMVVGADQAYIANAMLAAERRLEEGRKALRAEVVVAMRRAISDPGRLS